MSLLKDSPEVCQILGIRIMFTTGHRDYGGFFFLPSPGITPPSSPETGSSKGRKGEVECDEFQVYGALEWVTIPVYPIRSVVV